MGATTVWDDDAALTTTAHAAGLDAALSVHPTRPNGKMIIRTRYVPVTVNLPKHPDMQKLYIWCAMASDGDAYERLRKMGTVGNIPIVTLTKIPAVGDKTADETFGALVLGGFGIHGVKLPVKFARLAATEDHNLLCAKATNRWSYYEHWPYLRKSSRNLMFMAGGNIPDVDTVNQADEQLHWESTSLLNAMIVSPTGAWGDGGVEK